MSQADIAKNVNGGNYILPAPVPALEQALALQTMNVLQDVFARMGSHHGVVKLAMLMGLEGAKKSFGVVVTSVVDHLCKMSHWSDGARAVLDLLRWMFRFLFHRAPLPTVVEEVRSPRVGFVPHPLFWFQLDRISRDVLTLVLGDREEGDGEGEGEKVTYSKHVISASVDISGKDKVVVHEVWKDVYVETPEFIACLSSRPLLATSSYQSASSTPSSLDVSPS
jgi:hypothetical protein